MCVCVRVWMLPHLCTGVHVMCICTCVGQRLIPVSSSVTLHCMYWSIVSYLNLQLTHLVCLASLCMLRILILASAVLALQGGCDIRPASSICYLGAECWELLYPLSHLQDGLISMSFSVLLPHAHENGRELALLHWPRMEKTRDSYRDRNKTQPTPIQRDKTKICSLMSKTGIITNVPPISCCCIKHADKTQPHSHKNKMEWEPRPSLEGRFITDGGLYLPRREHCCAAGCKVLHLTWPRASFPDNWTIKFMAQAAQERRVLFSG